MIQFDNLKGIGNSEILSCFNEAFSDYQVPLQLTMDQLESKLHAEDINKAISIGAYKENRLVGFVLHGIRDIQDKRMVYNAGTGVIPSERGQKITKRMYEYILPHLHEAKVNEVILEVLDNNVAAMKTYELLGFEYRRDFNCYKGDLRIETYNEDIRIVSSKHLKIELLGHFGAIQPSWQNTTETIVNLDKQASCVLAYKEEQLCGYCIIQPAKNRLLQIAVKPSMRNQGIGRSLLKYVEANICKHVAIINVDTSCSATQHFLEKCNLNPFIHQREMRWVLTN